MHIGSMCANEIPSKDEMKFHYHQVNIGGELRDGG